MQEIPAVKAKSTDIYDQLRSAALVDMGSQTRAFADFLSILDRPASPQSSAGSQNGFLFQDASPAQATAAQNANAQAALATQDASTSALPVVPTMAQSGQNANAQAAAQSAQTTQTSSPAASQTAQVKTSGQDPRLNSAKNAPVSREAFEEVRPALTRLGMSDKEIEDLSARVQAGQLTWGKLVHSMSAHVTGAKQPVELSTSQSLDLQALFQKLGFSPDASKGLVADVAKGDGAKVLAQIQQKLSTMQDDQSLGLDSKEMATLFKALKLPEATANKLAQLFNSDTTVAGLKGGLALAGQEMLQQRSQGEAKDADLLRAVGKVMQKDMDKSRREAGLATSSDAKQQAQDSGQPRLTIEVKTPDRNDTRFFDKHEQQQQQAKHPGAEDNSWRDFLARVKGDDTSAKSGSSAAAAKDSLDALLGKAASQLTAQQPSTGTTQSGSAWEKVAAPKLLNQVQNALLKDLGQGLKQMTLDLDPANLGKLQVMLQVKGKEVSATLRADDPETAKMLVANLDTIKKSLEDQGLKVQNLEVQTGLASRQDQQQLFSADQHNQAQERQDLTNLFTRLRNLRADGGSLAQEMQNGGMQAILSDKGLHVIA